MNIIELAKEVFRGDFSITHSRYDYLLTTDELVDRCERFANLIIEECAKVCDETGYLEHEATRREIAAAIREMKHE